MSFLAERLLRKFILKYFSIIFQLVNSQKYLDLHLDSKLSFDIHIKSVLTKVNRTIGLLEKFQHLLPRTSLITVCKTTFKLWIL